MDEAREAVKLVLSTQTNENLDISNGMYLYGADNLPNSVYFQVNKGYAIVLLPSNFVAEFSLESDITLKPGKNYYLHILGYYTLKDNIFCHNENGTKISKEKTFIDFSAYKENFLYTLRNIDNGVQSTPLNELKLKSYLANFRQGQGYKFCVPLSASLLLNYMDRQWSTAFIPPHVNNTQLFEIKNYFTNAERVFPDDELYAVQIVTGKFPFRGLRKYMTDNGLSQNYVVNYRSYNYDKIKSLISKNFPVSLYVKPYISEVGTGKESHQVTVYSTFRIAAGATYMRINNGQGVNKVISNVPSWYEDIWYFERK